MKLIGMIGIGLLLIGAFFGVASASVTAIAPPAQRATRTPSPTAVLRVPVTLVARPLPVILPITTTPLITSTPSITLAQALTLTVRVTPTLRTTPTPVVRSTPTVAPAAADASTGIVDFSALPSRLRGQIDLSWGYVGAPFAGEFVIERSANGGVWRYVVDCTQPYAADADLYRCRDTGLTSGATYAYRACILDYGYSCAGADVVESGAVKAP